MYFTARGMRAGSKRKCVVLCDFYFCCAFTFCQPMKKFEFLARPEPLVNDMILRRVALGTRMVATKKQDILHNNAFLTTGMMLVMHVSKVNTRVFPHGVPSRFPTSTNVALQGLRKRLLNSTGI